MASFTIPKSTVDEFYRNRVEDGRRLGQQFYDYIEANKMTQDEHWLARLYCADGAHARNLIRQVTDFDN